jgi:hypothetical protein
MRVQHRAGAALLYDPYMEQTFIGRFTTMLAHDSRILVDREELIRREFTLIDPTRTHRDPQRLTLDHRTQIPTSPEQPPAPMKTPGDGGKPGTELLKVVRHHGKRCHKKAQNAQTSKAFCYL